MTFQVCTNTPKIGASHCTCLTALRNRQGSAAATVLSDFGYEYSTAGDLTRWHRTLGAGTVSDWHLESDPLGQLTALTEKNTAGAVTKTWGWAYDASGNRTHEVEGTAMRLAAIGGANRLDQIGGAGNALFEGSLDEPGEVTVNGAPATVRALPGGEQHLFSKELQLGAGTHQVQIQATDPSQNTTLKTYAVTVGGVERTLTYDTNGNLIREAEAGGSIRVFEWDALNRLTAIQSDAAPVDGSWRTEMTYDGHSRRIRLVEKIRAASAWTTQSDHRYLWEGTTIVQKRDATGSTVTAKYFDQGEIRASTPYHFSRDHLGSIREVVANNGTVAARFDYTAWGERSTVSGGSFELEWGFTGHHYHAKSGLHLAMFRAYDANLGRWLSEDPIGEMGGVNLYGYVGNRPTHAADLFGLNPCDDLLAAIEETIEAIEHNLKQLANDPKNLYKYARDTPVPPGFRPRTWDKYPRNRDGTYKGHQQKVRDLRRKLDKQLRDFNDNHCPNGLPATVEAAINAPIPDQPIGSPRQETQEPYVRPPLPDGPIGPGIPIDFPRVPRIPFLPVIPPSRY